MAHDVVPMGVGERQAKNLPASRQVRVAFPKAGLAGNIMA